MVQLIVTMYDLGIRLNEYCSKLSPITLFLSNILKCLHKTGIVKFIQLLNADKAKDINYLSYYEYHAFKVRNAKTQTNVI